MRDKFRNLQLDKIDLAIIDNLQKDGRISNSDLADKVGLSQSACLRRVKGLETQGVIEGYVAVMDQTAAGLPDNVFVQITVEKQTKEHSSSCAFRVDGRSLCVVRRSSA